MKDDTSVLPLEDVYVDERLNYVEKLVAILEKKTKTLRNMVIEFVNVK